MVMLSRLRVRMATVGAGLGLSVGVAGARLATRVELGVCVGVKLGVGVALCVAAWVGAEVGAGVRVAVDMGVSVDLGVAIGAFAVRVGRVISVPTTWVAARSGVGEGVPPQAVAARARKIRIKMRILFASNTSNTTMSRQKWFNSRPPLVSIRAHKAGIDRPFTGHTQPTGALSTSLATHPAHLPFFGDLAIHIAAEINLNNFLLLVGGLVFKLYRDPRRRSILHADDIIDDNVSARIFL